MGITGDRNSCGRPTVGRRACIGCVHNCCARAECGEGPEEHGDEHELHGEVLGLDALPLHRRGLAMDGDGGIQGRRR